MKNVRIWFEKDGPARYISHLDLNRCMTRVLYRSQIPIWHTEGFNPHPFITFALPLSLGFRGKRESMDIKLLEDIPESELIMRLNSCLPAGIRVFAVTEPVMKPGRITYALFDLLLESDIHPVQQVEAAVMQVLSMPEIMVSKKSKAGIKEVDLKENICKYDVTTDAVGVHLLITLPAGSVNNVNPTLLLEAIQQITGVQIRADITRVDIYNEEVESFK